MRKRNNGMSRLAAYVLGPAVALFVLLAAFSLMPYEWLTSPWPLGIQQAEVAAYQRWFDHRPGTIATAELPLLSIAGDKAIGTGAEERKVLWGGQEALLSLALVNEVIHAEVPGDSTWQGVHAFDLLPLTPGLVRLAHLREVAMAHGSLVPVVKLVRVGAGGDDLGPRLLVERITPGRLEGAGGIPGPLITLHGERVRTDAAADAGAAADASLAYAALRAGERAPLDSAAAALRSWFTAAGFGNFLDSARFVLDPWSGRLLPLLDLVGRDVAVDGAGWAAGCHPLAGRWQRAMAADTAGWMARLSAIDAQWAPALANGGSTAFLEAGLRQQRESLLRALTAAPAPAAATAARAQAPALDAWLKPYLGADDTLRFTRGKHRIERTIECPPGMGVVMEKGARFTIAPGAALVVNGPLHIRGTGLNPVFIRPVDAAAAYGAIAVNGTGGTRCRVRGLRISGGSSFNSRGRRHAAMLSFHDCDVVVESSELGPAAGPSMLDVRGGRVAINGTQVSVGGQVGIGLGRTVAVLRQSGCSLAADGGAAAVAVRVEGGQALLLDTRLEGAFATGVEATAGATALLRGCRMNGAAVAVMADSGGHVHAERCTGEVRVPFRAGAGNGRRGGRVDAVGNTFQGALRPEEHTAPGSVRFVGEMDTLMVRSFGSVR